MTSTAVMVGMAEIHVLKGPGTFSCLGLGSCIGLCALDPVSNVAGCAHIMLPAAFADKKVERPGKFADTGVPEMIAMMERLGAQRNRLMLTMAGGAQVFRYGGDAHQSKLDIGARNAVAVDEALKQLGLTVRIKDVGGNQGRTVLFVAETGLVTVRTATTPERPLANLRK